jgi:hypothetical protein
MDKAQNSKHKTQSTNLKAQNSKHKIQNNIKCSKVLMFKTGTRKNLLLILQLF